MQRATSTNDRTQALARAYRERFGNEPDGIAEAPGRVNLIGEHLDYNEGFVLPAAIDRGLQVAFGHRQRREVRAYSLDFDEAQNFALDSHTRLESGKWSTHIGGVLSVLRDEGISGPGLNLAISGDVPIGAGLASSAALEVALLGALRSAWEIDVGDRLLATLAQRAENEYVGVQCGIMDQLAVVFGRLDHALLIDCRSTDIEQVPLGLETANVELIVVDSGVRRKLSDSAYNRRREECTAALRLLREVISPPPLALRDVSSEDLATHADRLSPDLRARVRHVISEGERVSHAASALRRGALVRFGALMNASHSSLRDDYDVSCPELDSLCELATNAPGVLGARLTGAGFGGCTVNLVRRDAVESFRAGVLERYRAETGLPADCHVCRASDGLRVLPRR